MTVRTVIKLGGPFDLGLSLRAAASFLPSTGTAIRSLRLAIPIADRPAIVEIRQQRSTPAIIEAVTTAAIPRARLEDLALWLTSGDLDLRQFYRITTTLPLMAPIARRLRGLKPLRPASLFEMAIIAITEQQLSLAAAFHIRKRLLERFGKPIEDLYVVPSADVVATAALRDLTACGLSQRKAEYVRDFAKSVVSGDLALEALKHQTDTEVRNRLIRCRGFGAWSVEYFLLRGLGRFDCLPSDDVGLRRTIAPYLARRRRLSPRQLESALSPFAPFRGLAAFYLAVDFRLRQHRIPATGCSSSEAGK
jgi:3-methyladenine DNA glycosylase/8-oxoguanine DNA glycosylase